MQINTDYNTINFQSKNSTITKRTVATAEKISANKNKTDSIKLLKRSPMRDSINHIRYKLRHFIEKALCEDVN